MIRDFKKIGFVTSLDHENDEPFEKMLAFAAIFKSEIVIINMDEPGFFRDPLLVVRKAMEDYQNIAKAKGFKCSIKRLANGQLEEQLTGLISENELDLLVVPTHGKNAFVRIFTSSIAEAIVNHLHKPVMTIKM